MSADQFLLYWMEAHPKILLDSCCCALVSVNFVDCMVLGQSIQEIKVQSELQREYKTLMHNYTIFMCIHLPQI